MTGIAQIWTRTRMLVLRRGVPRDEADDLVQEAFLRLERYERDHEVRSREAFVRQAAINLTVDRARRGARSPYQDCSGVIDLAEVRDDIAAPDEELEGRAKLAHLERGLAQLPDKVRRALLMRRLDGMTFKEIARIEGQSVSAIEKQVARATLMLMKWMAGW